MKDILLVSFGAILGANTRFIIYKKFERINLSMDICILTINILATFFLGLLLSILTGIESYNFSYKLALFFITGFIGSLSTFSTFIYDLFDLFLQNKFFRALKLFSLSFSLGIIALAVGSFLGKQ